MGVRRAARRARSAWSRRPAALRRVPATPHSLPVQRRDQVRGPRQRTRQGRLLPEPVQPLQPTADHSPLYVVYLSVVGVLRNHQASEFDFVIWTCFLGAGTVILIGLAGREIAVRASVCWPRRWPRWTRRCGCTTACCSPRPWRSSRPSASSWSCTACTGPRLSRVCSGSASGAGSARCARSELALVGAVPACPADPACRGTWTWRKRSPVARRRRCPRGVDDRSLDRVPTGAGSTNRCYSPTNFGRTMAAAKCSGGYSGPFFGAESYDCLARDRPHQGEAGDGRVRRSTASTGPRRIDTSRRTRLGRWSRSRRAGAGSSGSSDRPRSCPYSSTARRRAWSSVGWMATISFYVLLPRRDLRRVPAAPAAGSVYPTARVLGDDPLLDHVDVRASSGTGDR